jgi:hypothetical protein
MESKSTWLDGIADTHLHRLLSERAARYLSGSSTFTATDGADEAFEWTSRCRCATRALSILLDHDESYRDELASTAGSKDEVRLQAALARVGHVNFSSDNAVAH